MNKIGIGTPNGSTDITEMLDMGFSTYLIVHGGHGPDQARQIKQRYPDARIYVRRVGGIGSSPRDVLHECQEMMNAYEPLNIHDVIAWNEADRIEEGGFSSSAIAEFASSFLSLVRSEKPQWRVHWPALAHLQRYQAFEPSLWLPVAQQYDVIDFHAYNDPGNVRAFFQWISTFLPDKPIACTEYNYGPGNPRPDDYGAWIYETYRLAIQDFPNAEAVCPFIWEWINPESGIGTSLDIRVDESAKNGIRRAFTIPQPLEPLPVEPEDDMTNRERYEPLARTIARELGLDADVFVKQITQESNWNPTVVSPAGAEGLGQLMPQYYPNVDRFDPEDNLRAAAASMVSYVGSMRQNFPNDNYTALALASYNAGLTAMTKWRNKFGVSWRRALTSNRTDWNAVTGYANELKADQVARYLDSILGAEEEVIVPQPESNVLDLTWIGSPNYTAGRKSVLAIVDHIMEGTLAACDVWFQQTATPVSAHFGIGKNGEIHQYVRTTDTAWANGVLNRPDTSIEWIKNCVVNGVNPNSVTVSIEHEGKSGEAFTEAQYQATLKVHRYLIATYKIPVDVQHIVGHNKIDSVNRARCPGIGFPWTRLMKDLTTVAPQPQPTPVDKTPFWKELSTIGLEVRALGDTLYSVNRPNDSTYTSPFTDQQSLDESWRIKNLLEGYVTRIVELVDAIKR